MSDALVQSIVAEDIDYSVFQAEACTPSTDSIRWPARWRDAVIEKIQQLAGLPPNWDSYGARQVDPMSIHFAACRLQMLATETDREPRISCVPSGNVVLAWEWDHDRKACELEFRPDGLIWAMFADDSDPSATVEDMFSGIGPLLPLIPGTGT